MWPVIALVTTPPTIETLTTSVVPWTTSPPVGASRLIFTGVDGRWPRPPTGVGYGVGAGGPEPVAPSAAADPHAVTQMSRTIIRTRHGRRMVFNSLPRSIMSKAGNFEALPGGVPAPAAAASAQAVGGRPLVGDRYLRSVALEDAAHLLRS